MKSGAWRINFGLLIPVLVLLILSLTTLFSVSPALFKSQLVFTGVSIAAFFLFSQINYNALRMYGVPIYIVSLILLVGVLILGIESRGAVRWIEIFGSRLQLSEILKPFLAVSLASFLVRKPNYSFSGLFEILFFMMVISMLIFLQPDLGSAIIYIFVTILTLIYFGYSLRFFATGLVFLGIIAPLIWRFLRDYQRERILTFINPTKDPLGTSYNAIQSIIAVGSGMLWGKGLGQGTQSGLSFLPERHTDFIFATISEQLGFVGALIIIGAFVFLLYRIYKLMVYSDDQFCRVFCAIAFFIILVQFFVNVGMNIGILPVVGVTLPFVSYGGSSLLSNFILLGLLSSVTKGERRTEALEIR